MTAAAAGAAAPVKIEAATRSVLTLLAKMLAWYVICFTCHKALTRTVSGMSRVSILTRCCQ